MYLKVIPSSYVQPHIAECRTLAKSLSLEWYRSNRGVDPEKYRQDFLYGKVGEWAVWNLCKNIFNKEFSPPSMFDYKKGFDPDLIGETQNIEVKSVPLHSAKKYGYSWSFTVKENPELHNPSPSTLVSLISHDHFNYYFHGFIDLPTVVSNLRAPKEYHSSAYKMFIDYSVIKDSILTSLA